MAERLSNLGYLLVGDEVTAGTAVTPSVAVPFYKETMVSNQNPVEETPVVGIKFEPFQMIPGQRDHKGDIEVLAEGNTAAYFVDMLLTVGAATGGGPYTYAGTLSTTTAPKSKTIDISYANIVYRFYGCQASKITPAYDKNEMRLNVSLSALGAFGPRKIGSITGAGPYSVTLDTAYDQSPTTGLVAGDLIRFYHAGSATVDATVTAITNGTTFTTTTSPAPAVAGDTMYLRPQTPTLTLLAPFTWAKTQFCFGATAAAALSAAQTRLESGTNWSVTHKFESDNGAERSGGLDPASLVRLTGGAAFKYKKFFDTPEDMQQWSITGGNACVVRHYAGSTNQYEFRVTLNNLVPKTTPQPKADSSKILYSDIDYVAVYNATDGQAFDIKVINNLATI